MITILILILVTFIGCGLFAGAEMAYLSCNKLKLRHLADQGNHNARLVMRFHSNPHRFLTTVLVGYNLMHVTLIALATYVFETRFGIDEEWVVVLVMAPLVIIFAETVPKDWFRYKADDFIYRFAPILALLDRALSGFSKMLEIITDILIALSGSSTKRSPFVTREEFGYVVDESAKKGVLHQHEKKMIHTILNLSTKPVNEVMIPLSKFPKISLTSKISDVKRIARKTKADAILVYEEIPSIVVGIIYVFDILFEQNEDKPLSQYLKAPLFISHDMSSEKALFTIQSKRCSYAVVINPLREVVGVVELENLIRI